MAPGRSLVQEAFLGTFHVLADRLRERLLDRADLPAVTICGGRAGKPDLTLSGRQLHEAALGRRAQIERLVQPEDGPLALVMPCGADFVVTLFAAIYGGFTATAVAPPRPGVQTLRFNEIVRDCAPAAILCSDGLTSRIQVALSDNGPAIPLILDVTGWAGDGAGTDLDAPRSLGRDRPAILQYTSGSTRAPRAVALSGLDILANAHFTNASWAMDEDAVVVSWLPHFHDLGLMSVFYPLLAGGRTVLLDPLHMIQRPERWLRLISDYGATVSGGPAFAFAHCLENIPEAQLVGLDLSSWRSAFCGAEPVPSGLLAAFRDRYAPYGLDPDAVFGTYGLAEFTLMVAGGSPPTGGDRPVTPDGCGDIEPCRIAADMRDNLRLVDPDTRRVMAAEEAGEIWVRGASVAQGYRNAPAETAAVFDAVLADDGSRGWLRTGDLAVRQGDWLYVTGRLKDLLFANGRKIPATDVEWLAGEQDEALNPMAAAALMADELVTGKAVLLIELKRRARLGDEVAARDLIRRTAATAWGIELTEIRFLASGSLPRTSSGKIRRRVVANAWREGRVEEVLQ